MAMDSILDRLLDDFKEKIGECNSAKELWDNIKYLYLVEQRAKERLFFLRMLVKMKKIYLYGQQTQMRNQKWT